MREVRRAACALSAVLTLGCAGAIFAQSVPDALEQGFRTPPDSAKPRTWMHWTNGNVTKEGITKDLEWMKRAGIGGIQMADVSGGGGHHVALAGRPGSQSVVDMDGGHLTTRGPGQDQERQRVGTTRHAADESRTRRGERATGQQPAHDGIVGQPLGRSGHRLSAGLPAPCPRGRSTPRDRGSPRARAATRVRARRCRGVPVLRTPRRRR